jgi:hypothetical protein
LHVSRAFLPRVLGTLLAILLPRTECLAGKSAVNVPSGRSSLTASYYFGGGRASAD